MIWFYTLLLKQLLGKTLFDKNKDYSLDIQYIINELTNTFFKSKLHNEIPNYIDALVNIVRQGMTSNDRTQTDKLRAW